MSFFYLQEIDILSLPENDGQLTDRNKRTIGILRELFPELSRVCIDNKPKSSKNIFVFIQKHRNFQTLALILIMNAHILNKNKKIDHPPFFIQQ